MSEYTYDPWTNGIQGKLPMRMKKEEIEKLKASADTLKSVIAQIEW